MRTRGGDHGWRTTISLAALGLAARLAYLSTTASEGLRSDALHYHEIAASLAAGDGFSHNFPQLEAHATAFRPPGLPALLSVVYRLVGASPGIGRAVAVGLGVALVVLTHRVLRRHVDPTAATVGAALVAVFPPLVANDTVPLTESLSLLLLVVLCDRIAARSWPWAGAILGLLVLTRPSAQGLALTLGALLVIQVGWKRTLGSLAIAAAVVAPWVARNATQVGTTSIVTSNAFNLAAMYSTEARQAGGFVDPVFHPGFDDMRILQFDEAAWEAELQRRGLAGLREQPSYVAEVMGRNTLALFELQPHLTEHAQWLDGRNRTVSTWSRPLLWVLVPVGVVGLWRGRHHPFVAALGVCALTFGVLSLGLLAWPRLRAPVDYALCVGAALVLAARFGPGRTTDAEDPATEAEAPASEADISAPGDRRAAGRDAQDGW